MVGVGGVPLREEDGVVVSDPFPTGESRPEIGDVGKSFRLIHLGLDQGTDHDGTCIDQGVVREALRIKSDGVE